MSDLDLSSQLKLEMIQRRQLKNKVFDCDLCDYKTRSPGELNDHKKIRHDGFKLECEKCNFSTTQKSSLSVHIKAIHEK